ncbi:hypothetical protein GOP47_0022615 [Adiantum capillus-veneris]|uniref:SET domain-containing protein n=1 Tax=Adiantum capillus-veneris TaxID=13818 RepID=A0A9D4U5Q6_ADICA|nr:hypothetical protein GOP47_0022615 [Adiantum capillus-veneris]
MEESLQQLSIAVAPPTANAESSKLRKRKKKKSKSKLPSSLNALANSTSSLPSQKCVEARFPWKVVIRSGRGRCAIATRDIKAGELIVSEQALAFVLRSSYRTAACHNCCKDFTEASTGIQCQQCNHSFFCEECWQVTQNLHRDCCPVIRKIGDIAAQEDCDGDLLRLALLLGLKRSSLFNESSKESFDSMGEIKGDVLVPSFHDAMGLQTHRNKISASWRSSVRKACERLVDHAASQISDFQNSAEDLEYLAALINANAHGMGAQGVHNTDIAIGIFPFVSMLNHSCRPNCCFSSDRNFMHVRATHDVRNNTELCLSYINLYEARDTRREQLATTKHFDCACTRCTEPLTSSVDRFLEGVVCYVKGCSGVLVKQPQESPAAQPPELWQCDTCSGILDATLSSGQVRPLAERPWNLVYYAQERLSAANLVYKERRFKEARKLLEDFLLEFTGKLHPLHVLLFDALTPLMNCCRVLGDAEGGTKVCRNIINSLEKVLNSPCIELANFYLCLGEMYSERADSVDSSAILAKRYKKQDSSPHANGVILCHEIRVHTVVHPLKHGRCLIHVLGSPVNEFT